MRKRKKMYKPIIINNFSMIELMLTLFLVVVGIMGVTSLMPVGLDQQAKSMGTTYSVDAGDQFVRYNASQIRSDRTWADQFPTEKPSLNEFSLEGWNASPMFSVDNSSVYEALSSNTGMFLHEQSTDGEVAYRSIFRIWKSVEMSENGAENIVLFLEASWPAAQPYYAREKSTFTVETFKAPEIAFDTVTDAVVCSVFDHALFSVGGRIKLDNLKNVTVNGDIRSDGDTITFNKMDSLIINGNIASTNGVSFNNIDLGSMDGDLTTEGSVSGQSEMTLNGTVSESTIIEAVTLPELTAPMDASDPNYPHPITIVTGDYSLSGNIALEGTIYATGDLHISSGQTITGSGVLVAGGKIHVNNINGTIGGLGSEIFIYALNDEIHFNNCDDVEIQGILYAPNGSVKANNLNSLTVNGGIYSANAALDFVNINDITIGSGNSMKDAIPPGMLCSGSNANLAIDSAGDTFTVDAGMSLVVSE